MDTHYETFMIKGKLQKVKVGYHHYFQSYTTDDRWISIKVALSTIAVVFMVGMLIGRFI
jgi:hypothetical protein